MTPDRVQQLLDVEEIKKLKARYFRAVDAKEWKAFAALFTEDLEFLFAQPGQPFVPSGATVTSDGFARVTRDELIAFLEQMGEIKTVHHCYMPEITLVDRDEAVGLWSMTDHTRVPGPDGPVWMRGYGTYEERYRRTGDGWRIQRTVLTRHDFDPAPSEQGA